MINFSVARRRRELGIRIALGAIRARLFSLVLHESLLLTGVGLGTGWLLGAAAASVVAHELVGVSPWDPATAFISSFVILASSIAATFIPARRAAASDPRIAVRTE